MVYVDRMRACMPNRNWRYKQSCHMYADTLEELHVFAAKMGMKRCWFQNKLTLQHYDLTVAKRALAISLGAKAVTDIEFVETIRQRRSLLSGSSKSHG